MRLVVLGLLAAVAAGAVGTLDPLLMRHLIDVSLPQRQLTGSLLTVFALALCFVGRSVFGGIGGLFTFRVAQLLGQDLKENMLSHMTHLSVDWHEKTPLGEKLSRIDQDIVQISQFGAELANSIVRAVVFFIVNLIIMFTLNWRMTLLVLPMLPLFLAVRQRFRALIQLRADSAQAEIGKATSRIAEHLGAVPQVQMLGAEQARVSYSVEAWIVALSAQWAQRRTEIAFSVSVTSVLALAILLVLGFGAHQYLIGALSLGGLVAFYAYVTRIFEPVSTAMELYSRTQRMLASARRVRAVLEERSSVPDLGNIKEVPNPLRLGLCCEVVSFRYGRAVRVLDNISIEISGRERIALIGKSGSGKSTLARLLVRVADPVSGAVLLEGEPLAAYSLSALRASICYVPQHPVLFSGTIRENLLIAKPHATEPEIDRVIEVTQLRGVISRLPLGHDTELGPDAAGLSGGERQRLALARALLREPQILVLDESTSALDLPTETEVMRAVAGYCAQNALVIISHRLRSLTWVDRMVVLDSGHVAASGHHRELYEGCPLYRELYETEEQLDTRVDERSVEADGDDGPGVIRGHEVQTGINTSLQS